MTNKIDTVLKSITDQIARTLPSNMVKNPKLSTSPVLSARSYPTQDPQCSNHVHGSINAITIHPKQPNEIGNDESEEKEHGKKGSPEDTNTMVHNDEQRDTTIDNLGPNRNDDEIEWLDVEEPLDLVDTTNAYIDVDLPMNIMSLAYYNSIRKDRYEYMGRNFVGLGRDMHIFVGNMSYVMDFTILENIETNIDPSLDGIKEITFKTPYKDPERSELSSEGHDLLSSRVILSEDDYDRGWRRPSDLEDGSYRDTIKLGPEYLTGMEDEGDRRGVRHLMRLEKEMMDDEGEVT
ncbi:hypothetical protein Tco_1398885 [Tanacetum coccineum]